MEKMNGNLQKNSPKKIFGKRNRCNQGCTSATAGDVIFEVGLLVVLPVQPGAVGGAASTQCFFCNKSIKGKDIFMYRDKGFCGNECRSWQINEDEIEWKPVEV